MWFIKCRLPLRRGFVRFIVKVSVTDLFYDDDNNSHLSSVVLSFNRPTILLRRRPVTTAINSSLADKWNLSSIGSGLNVLSVGLLQFSACWSRWYSSTRSPVHPEWCRPSALQYSPSRPHYTVLRSLHWLSVRQSVVSKTAAFVWKCFHGNALHYLAELVVSRPLLRRVVSNFVPRLLVS